MMEPFAKSCSDRLELDCLCKMLRAKIGSDAPNVTKQTLDMLERKVYDPTELYSKAKSDVYDCLKDNDFMLHKLTAVISGVYSKVNVSDTGETDKAFDVEAPLTDLQNEIESGFGVSHVSGSSPIKLIYVNGNLVDENMNTIGNSSI